MPNYRHDQSVPSSSESCGHCRQANPNCSATSRAIIDFADKDYQTPSSATYQSPTSIEQLVRIAGHTRTVGASKTPNNTSRPNTASVVHSKRAEPKINKDRLLVSVLSGTITDQQTIKYHKIWHDIRSFEFYNNRVSFVDNKQGFLNWVLEGMLKK